MQAIYINATSGGMGKIARQCFEVIDNRYVLISWIKEGQVMHLCFSAINFVINLSSRHSSILKALK